VILVEPKMRYVVLLIDIATEPSGGGTAAMALDMPSASNRTRSSDGLSSLEAPTTTGMKPAQPQSNAYVTAGVPSVGGDVRRGDGVVVGARESQRGGNTTLLAPPQNAPSRLGRRLI